MPKATDTPTMSARDPRTAGEHPNGRAAPASTIAPLSVLDVGRAMQALDNARNRWDEYAVKLSDAEAERAERARDQLDARRDVLRDYILATPAATLAEALAQVDAAMVIAALGAGGTPVGADNREELFDQLLTALASIAGVLIREVAPDVTEAVCSKFTIEAMAREFPYLGVGEGV